MASGSRSGSPTWPDSIDEDLLIRVFHLIKSLGRGGAETLLVHGLDSADRESFEYGYGYFLPWKNQLVSELEARGAEVVEFTAHTQVQCLGQATAIARHLREWGADIVHCHLPVASIAGRIAAKMVGIPVVSTEHNLLQRYHPATRLGTLATWRLQDLVIAVSAEVQQSIWEHVGEVVPTRVVLNGVAVDAFRRDQDAAAGVRAQWGIPQDAPVVGTVAVFRTQKRLADWLRVARQVLQVRPDAHFLLVGDGPERPQIETARAELGLEGRVHICGLQADVRPFLSAMDVYLMSSKFEGLPIAMLEAMSTGLPVVATSVGGIPEVIREGVEGHLAQPGEVRRLSEGLLSLLADPVRLGTVGEAARRRVEASFGMRRMQAALEDIYREVLAR